MGTIGKWIVPVDYNYLGGKEITDENFASVTCDIYNSTMAPTYCKNEEVRAEMLKSEENKNLYENDRKKFNRKFNNIKQEFPNL